MALVRPGVALGHKLCINIKSHQLTLPAMSHATSKRRDWVTASKAGTHRSAARAARGWTLAFAGESAHLLYRKEPSFFLARSV